MSWKTGQEMQPPVPNFQITDFPVDGTPYEKGMPGDESLNKTFLSTLFPQLSLRAPELTKF